MTDLDHTTTRIALAGSRGGHGTTALAVALADYLARGPVPVMLDAVDADSVAGITGGAGSHPEPGTHLAPGLILGEPADGFHAVADCGTLADVGRAQARSPWAYATHRILLVAPCYLSLRTAVAYTGAPAPTLVALVGWPGRTLSHADARGILDWPMLPRPLAWSPEIGRNLDAGLLTVRQPAAMRANVTRILDACGLAVAGADAPVTQ